MLSAEGEDENYIANSKQLRFAQLYLSQTSPFEKEEKTKTSHIHYSLSWL